MFRQLDEKFLVSGQIGPEHMEEVRGAGVTMLINNRADNEEPGQPLSVDLEKAAQAAGLDYRHVPIIRGMGPADVEAMRDAIHHTGEGKLLAFCRSGNRSTLAWAVARAEDGVPRDELERRAEAAGFSLAPVNHLL